MPQAGPSKLINDHILSLLYCLVDLCTILVELFELVVCSAGQEMVVRSCRKCRWNIFRFCQNFLQEFCGLQWKISPFKKTDFFPAENFQPKSKIFWFLGWNFSCFSGQKWKRKLLVWHKMSPLSLVNCLICCLSESGSIAFLAGFPLWYGSFGVIFKGNNEQINFSLVKP